jgi:hypothetical protein
MRKLVSPRRVACGVVAVSRSRLGGVGLAGAVSVLLVLGASAAAATGDVSPATAPRRRLWFRAVNWSEVVITATGWLRPTSGAYRFQA